MTAYFDTSVITKRYLPEPDSAQALRVRTQFVPPETEMIGGSNPCPAPYKNSRMSFAADALYQAQVVP